MNKYRFVAIIFSFLIVLQMIPISMTITSERQTLENQNTNFVFSDTFQPENFTGRINATFFTSPDSAFDEVIKTVRLTQSEFVMEVYSLWNPWLIKEIGDIFTRNGSANVRIILEKSPVGSYERSYNYGSAWNLTKAGAHMFWASTSFPYQHSKFAVIDQKIVILMTGNWGLANVPVDPSYGNREWGVIIYNETIADYFLRVYYNDEAIASPYVLNETDAEKQRTEEIKTGSYDHPFNATNFFEPMTITPILAPDFAVSLIHHWLRAANTSILLAQNYIYSDWGTAGENIFLQDLIAAKERGVDVKVIVNRDYNHDEEIAAILMQHNISIMFSPSKFATYHVKGIIIDGNVVLLSSINWSYTSPNLNRESGVVVQNTNVAAYYTQVFNWDWDHGRVPNISTTNSTSSSSTNSTSSSSSSTPSSTNNTTTMPEFTMEQEIMLAVAGFFALIIIAYIKKALK